jgi:hypothetical protein
MYKQAILENIAAMDRARSDYSKGLCTFYEVQHALRVLGETRKALIFDAYEQGDLNWVPDEEQAQQDRDDQQAEVDAAYKKGYDDARAAVAISNRETKFNP